MLSCVASAVLVFPLSLHVALPIYGRAGGEAALQFAVRQIVRVPELFGNHAALVGEFLDGFYEGQGIATGREFVMAAFAGEDWPAATDARAAEGAAVVFLAVTIVIVSAPAWTLGKVVLDDAIEDFDGGAHDGIIRTANAVTHEMEKIAADNISRGLKSAA